MTAADISIARSGDAIETELSLLRARREELAAGLPSQREALNRMADELGYLQAHGESITKLKGERARLRDAIEIDEDAISHLDASIAQGEQELKTAKIREAEDAVREKTAIAVEASAALYARIDEMLASMTPEIAHVNTLIAETEQAERVVESLTGKLPRLHPRVHDAITQRAPGIGGEMDTLLTLAAAREYVRTHPPKRRKSSE
jgi:chromosome segregation ATPase